MRIASLPADRPIIDERGTMTQHLRRFMNAVARLSILEGSGSPEGVEEAMATRLYMDTAGTAGAILYIKRVDSVAGDKTAGWVLT